MQVENLIPVLDVRDVEISMAFYCEMLGFTLQDKVEWAGRTEWALLRTGKVQLMLCASQDPHDDDEHRINDGIFYLHLENPEAVIVQLKHRGAQRGIEPEAQLGNKDFYLRDPDGYILWFSHRPPVKDKGIEPEEVQHRHMPVDGQNPAIERRENTTQRDCKPARTGHKGRIPT